MNTKKRIVGGQETQINQYPWMGLMRYGGRFYCGCSLINDRYVLTAAHCVHGFNAQRISILLLEHDRSKDNDTVTITRKVNIKLSIIFKIQKTKNYFVYVIFSIRY